MRRGGDGGEEKSQGKEVSAQKRAEKLEKSVDCDEKEVVSLVDEGPRSDLGQSKADPKPNTRRAERRKPTDPPQVFPGHAPYPRWRLEKAPDSRAAVRFLSDELRQEADVSPLQKPTGKTA